MEELQPAVLGLELAAVIGQHIVDPLRLASVSKGYDQPITSTENEDRRVIPAMCFPPDVDDNSHAMQAPCQWPENTVRHMQIESSEPSRRWHGISCSSLKSVPLNHLFQMRLSGADMTIALI
jgi:hypothetical protein